MPLICYVLACEDGGDPFPHLAMVSLSLARLLHPGLRVAILTDEQTQRLPDPAIRRLFDHADAVVAAKTPPADPRVRSRFLKTCMRQRVPGDCLLLDVDAVPVRPFMPHICRGSLIAAAFDRNRSNPRPHFPNWAKPLYAELNWRIPPSYYNSGVLYLPDTPQVGRICEEWHRRWLQCSERGIQQDQPALNSAIFESGGGVRVLPVRYNAMIGVSALFAWKAAILHFFASQGWPSADTRIHDVLRRLMQGTAVDWQEELAAFRNGGPWIDLGDRPNRHLVCGRLGGAARLYMRKAWQRVRSRAAARCVAGERAPHVSGAQELTTR